MAKSPKLAEPIATRARQYLLREDPYGEMGVVAGPFSPWDDDPFEEALIGFLKEHPWDNDWVYRVLLIDERGKPDVEEFLPVYLAALITEAWEGFPQPAEPAEPAEGAITDGEIITDDNAGDRADDGVDLGADASPAGEFKPE